MRKNFVVHILLIRDVNVQQTTDLDVVIKQLNTKPLGNRTVGGGVFLPTVTLFRKLALYSIVNGDVFSNPEPIVIK